MGLLRGSRLQSPQHYINTYIDPFSDTHTYTHTYAHTYAYLSQADGSHQEVVDMWIVEVGFLNGGSVVVLFLQKEGQVGALYEIPGV